MTRLLLFLTSTFIAPAAWAQTTTPGVVSVDPGPGASVSSGISGSTNGATGGVSGNTNSISSGISGTTTGTASTGASGTNGVSSGLTTDSSTGVTSGLTTDGVSTTTQTPNTQLDAPMSQDPTQMDMPAARPDAMMNTQEMPENDVTPGEMTPSEFVQSQQNTEQGMMNSGMAEQGVMDSSAAEQNMMTGNADTLTTSASTWEVLAQSPNHQVLEELVLAADLQDMLDQDGPMTLFAPVDSAFGVFSQDQLQTVITDPDALTALLRMHVVQPGMDSRSLMNEDFVMNLAGTQLDLSFETGAQIGGANIVAGDVETSNGFLHSIDAVLLP